jgi:plastocyanin
MVGAINAPTKGNTLDAFISLAKNATESTSPPLGPVGGVLSTSNSQAASTIKVSVGADGKLAYSPNNITASVGTQVEFSFNPKVYTPKNNASRACHS